MHSGTGPNPSITGMGRRSGFEIDMPRQQNDLYQWNPESRKDFD